MPSQPARLKQRSVSIITRSPSISEFTVFSSRRCPRASRARSPYSAFAPDAYAHMIETLCGGDPQTIGRVQGRMRAMIGNLDVFQLRPGIDGLLERLAARGLLLVGLDVIGDKVTEINVTSPTCFQEIQQQTGFDVPAMFVDALERSLS